MKNESKWSLLFNPFDRIAGLKALLIGLILFCISTILAQLGGVTFNGLISVQVTSLNMVQAFIVHGISLMSLILVMYISGLIFSPTSIRFIDIAGTMTLSRIPFVLIAAVVAIPLVNESWRKFVAVIFSPDISSEPFIIAVFTVSMAIVLICIIWFVVLAYNAFSISCNIKGVRCGVIFTISFLIAFAVSMLLIMKIFSFTIPSVSPEYNTDVAGTVQQYETEIINEKGKQAADYIVNGRYDEATALFDDRMKKELTPEKLSEVMKSMEARFGKIVNIGDEVENTQINGSRIVLVPVEFEKMSIRFRFTFNEDDQIIGFYM